MFDKGVAEYTLQLTLSLIWTYIVPAIEHPGFIILENVHK